jgi:hypothetical protein
MGKPMATRVKVTYIAINEYKPILSASSFEAIKEGLNEYYGVDKGQAECLGFTPYNTKYPDDYEGHYSYSYTMKQYDKEITNIDVVKIYCVSYYPHTIYEI